MGQLRDHGAHSTLLVTSLHCFAHGTHMLTSTLSHSPPSLTLWWLLQEEVKAETYEESKAHHGKNIAQEAADAATAASDKEEGDKAGFVSVGIGMHMCGIPTMCVCLCV